MKRKESEPSRAMLIAALTCALIIAFHLALRLILVRAAWAERYLQIYTYNSSSDSVQGRYTASFFLDIVFVGLLLGLASAYFLRKRRLAVTAAHAICLGLMHLTACVTLNLVAAETLPWLDGSLANAINRAVVEAYRVCVIACFVLGLASIHPEEES